MSWFRMHPVIYWLLGIGLMAASIWFYFGSQKDEAAKALALTQDPPAAVEIASFDRATNVGPADEVVVKGQLDHTMRYTLTYKKKRRETTNWMVPLYASDTTERPDSVKFVLMGEANAVPMEALLESATGIAGERPIVEINGALSRPGKFRSMVSDALVEQGTTLARDAVFIEPFLEGREAGLAPQDGGPMGSAMIGGLGLLLFGYGFLRRNSRRKAAAA